MTPDPLDEVSRVYHAALERPPAERAAFLNEACIGDDALRQEVESLLGQEAASERFLERPSAEILAAVSAPVGAHVLNRQLGPYKIVALLGAGGMGEVYRARDTKLGRDVAIKILPSQFTADPERRSRFAREARLLATLNHPNIGAIYGLEETDGVTALVLELVDGPTLAERLERGPVPVSEGLAIARQIADALDSAHEKGIVHRDLKPANIVLQSATNTAGVPAGDVRAKVLDFGLGKALIVPGSSPAPATEGQPSAGTALGRLLGTPAYMSPEQIRGEAVDKRTDIWAFGCVLYEMVTGRRAFEGEGISDTLATVLRGEPDWTALPANVSPTLVALLRGCLDKDRRRRVADLSTARFILDREGEPVTAVAVPRASTIRRPASILVAVAAGAGIVVYTTFSLTRVSPPSLPVVRSTITLPMGDRFTNFGARAVALSADGTHLAYTANQRLYLRPLDQLDPTPIRGTEVDLAPGGASRNLFFSPDGRWIGFWQDGQLKKVSITGGAPLPLCPAENPWGVSWTSDNTILYGQREEGAGTGAAAGIWRVSSEGGKPEQVVKVEAGQIAHGPQLLPGGRAILFTLVARYGEWDTAQIVVQSLDTGKRDVVVERGADARYVPTGHLVYARDGTLFAVPFDVSRLAVTGDAVPLVDDVAQPGVAAQFAFSNQGALVYVPRDAIGELSRPRTLVWVDRQGREVPIKRMPPRNYWYPRLSSDGTRVALVLRDQAHDIWIWHLARETLDRLTLEPTFERVGVWGHDGKTVIYTSSTVSAPNAPRSLFRRSADFTGPAEPLLQGAVGMFPSTVTPDGTALLLRVHTPWASKVGALLGTDLLPFATDRRASTAAAPGGTF